MKRLKAYRKALAINVRRSSLAPSDVSAVREVGFATKRLAELAGNANDLTAAVDWQIKALALHEKALRMQPGSPDSIVAVATDLGELWAYYRRLGRHAEADASITRAVKESDRAYQLRPNDLEMERVAAANHSRLGRYRLDKQDWTGALEALERSNDLYARLTKTHPADMGLPRAQALVLFRLGLAQRGHASRSGVSAGERVTWSKQACDTLQQSAAMARKVRTQGKGPGAEFSEITDQSIAEALKPCAENGVLP